MERPPQTDLHAPSSRLAGDRPRAWADRVSDARLWFWAGLVFVASAFAFLELVDPFYFCQDDTLVGELPAILTTMRAAWQGISGGYDPYIFLGSPAPALAGVYPPLYLSYGIARLAIGTEYAMLDVSAALHITAGYCLAFLLARRLGVGPVLSALAALTYVLSGPVLVMARCWHAFSILAAFIPLFGLLVDVLRTGPVTWRWPVVTGICLGLFYHSGFPQLFVLGCGIMLLHAALLTLFGLLPWRRLAWLAPALAFGAAIAMPMFAQQWRFAKNLLENHLSFGRGVADGVVAMLLPYPLATGPMPNGWGNENLQWAGHFYYFGTVLLVGCLCSAIGLVRDRFGAANKPPADCNCEENNSRRLQLSLVFLALVSILLALGEWGGLWWLMERLPEGFRNNPFRALPWFVFFACLSGARFFEGFIAARPVAAGRSATAQHWLDLAGIAGIGFVLVALHLTRVSGLAFYSYGFRPYPPLAPAIARLIGPDEAGHRHRILSVAPLQTADPSYPLAIPRNLPCLYEVPAVLGYDPLVERLRRYKTALGRVVADPQAGLAAHGVRWVFVHRTAWGGWESDRSNPLEQLVTFAQLVERVSHNPQVSLPEFSDYLRVYEIPDPAPLAFDESEPKRPLQLEMTAAGLAIALDPEPRPRRVVANFLRYPDLQATTDGRPAVMAEDEWQRIVVEVPADARQIRIRNAPPRGPGIAAALLLALVGLVFLPVSKKVSC